MREKGRTGGGGRNGLFPNSLRIISSCLKTVSSNAGSVASSVRSAEASIAASIAVPADEEIKDQVLWAGFDKLELGPSTFKHILLLGYSNGFQVLDVDDASDVLELVSKRGGPVTYLQMQPIPAKLEGSEGFRSLHPMLLVVAGNESNGYDAVQGGRLSALIKDGCCETQQGTLVPTPTVVRFFSLKSNSIVHVLRFHSAVYIVRCNPRIVVVALAAQVYCFDAVTLENKFSVITYPIQGLNVTNVGHGPMALGSRWLAYASNNPISSNTGRLSPQNLTPSPGVSPSTSPSNGNLVARYAMESSKQLAVGIINLGDKGYKTLSKYCQDLLPDGSNSPISSSGRKLGKNSFSAHHSEADNAGMVIVKDFLSKDVISQFRAHTSPISALCFDPTGTLLVTASIHGNNINVFRIMPNSTSNGSNSTRYDSTSSHAHLYKLYRGLTTAIIQDISFSHHSQWITIVSSRGTCHIYFISPFGGDASFQSQISYDNGSIIVPNLSLPWWSTSSSIIGHQLISPPSTVTLSVVSRIKKGNSGWLNTVGNAAASAAGNFHVPSGAVSAVFHNSALKKIQKLNPLEQLLVYSPSGHVIQYELHPSSVGESCDSSSRSSSKPLLQTQDEELRVNAEAVQWWDVCRRSNWPERAEPISSFLTDECKNTEILVDTTSDCQENDTKCSELSTNNVCGKSKMHEGSSWYLSKAEVRETYGQIPIWQNSKITFYMINPPVGNWGSADGSGRGEVEIENFPTNEVQIRNKDLLPVFQHFHSVQPDWHDRGLSGGRFSAAEAASTEVYHNGVKLTERVIHPSATSNHFSEAMKNRGSRSEREKTGHYGRKEVIDGSKEIPIPTTSTIKKHDEDMETFHSGSAHYGNSVMDIPALGNFSFRSKMVTSDVSSVSDTNIHTPDSVEFPHYIQEEYCKISEVEDENSHDPNEGNTVAESINDDDMFGCVFAFSSEEG